MDSNKCIKTGKAKLILRLAKELVRTAVDLHHYYKCPSCGHYHVSSERKTNKEFYKKLSQRQKFKN